MVSIEEELVDELCQTWDQLMESSDVQRLSYCITWLKYAKKHMRLHLWPVRMIKLLLRYGPGDRMPPKDISRLLFFFYGNKLPFMCAADWVLGRVAICDKTTKTEAACQAIRRIVASYKIFNI